jgi:hypothetical protein
MKLMKWSFWSCHLHRCLFLYEIFVQWYILQLLSVYNLLVLFDLSEHFLLYFFGNYTLNFYWFVKNKHLCKWHDQKLHFINFIQAYRMQNILEPLNLEFVLLLLLSPLHISLCEPTNLHTTEISSVTNNFVVVVKTRSNDYNGTILFEVSHNEAIHLYYWSFETHVSKLVGSHKEICKGDNRTSQLIIAFLLLTKTLLLIIHMRHYDITIISKTNTPIHKRPQIIKKYSSNFLR